MVEPRPPRGKPGWVVLVEDDDALAKALQFALGLEGWRVDLRPSAAALLDRPMPDGPCCLVLDLPLPGIPGLAPLTELRRRGVESPVIVITGDPREAVRAAAEALGARIIEKPLLSGELLAAVRDALG